MKGAQVEVQKITEQIQQVFISPTKPPIKDVFELTFSQLACQALFVADIIISYSDVEHRLSTKFKKMVAKIKQAHKKRPLYDSDDSQEELPKAGGQLTSFLNFRKPIPDNQDRADFDWFVNKMQSKTKDALNFLDSMNRIKQVKGKKTVVNSWQMFTQQTQTDVSWVSKFEISGTDESQIENIFENLKQLPSFKKQIQYNFEAKKKIANNCNTQQREEKNQPYRQIKFKEKCLNNQQHQNEESAQNIFEKNQKQKNRKKKDKQLIKNRRPTKNNNLNRKKYFKDGNQSDQKEQHMNNVYKGDSCKKISQKNEKFQQTRANLHKVNNDKDQVIEQNKREGNNEIMQGQSQYANSKSIQSMQTREISKDRQISVHQNIQNKHKKQNNHQKHLREKGKVKNGGQFGVQENSRFEKQKKLQKINSESKTEIQVKDVEKIGKIKESQTQCNMNKQKKRETHQYLMAENVGKQQKWEQKSQNHIFKNSEMRAQMQTSRKGMQKQSREEKQNKENGSNNEMKLKNMKNGGFYDENAGIKQKIRNEMINHSQQIGNANNFSKIDILCEKDKNQVDGYRTFRKQPYHSSHSQQLPSIHKQTIQQSKFKLTHEQIELQSKIKKLMGTNPQAALLLLEQKDQQMLARLKQLGNDKGINHHKVKEYIFKVESLHKRICGTDCIHLKRFYKYLKNNYNNNRIPMAMATRKIGFFS